MLYGHRNSGQMPDTFPENAVHFLCTFTAQRIAGHCSAHWERQWVSERDAVCGTAY